MKNRCEYCGRYMKGGLRGIAEHDNCIPKYKYEPLTKKDLDKLIEEYEEEKQKEFKKQKENGPSYEEIVEAVKKMEDNRSYKIEYHPYIKTFMNGKVWKNIYLKDDI